jgi:hypothetical protein
MYVKDLIWLDPILGQKVWKVSEIYFLRLKKPPISPNFSPNKLPLYINIAVVMYYTHS